MMTPDEITGLLDAPADTLEMGLLESMRTEMAEIVAAIRVGDTQVPPGDLELMGMALQRLELEHRRRLDALVADLAGDFDRAVSARHDADRRMIDDERQFDGRRRLQYSKARPNDIDDEAVTDETRIHATRSRTLLASARLTDMLLPANEIPFRIDADEDPDPECVPTFRPPQPQPGPDGQPMPPTESDIRSALEDANTRAAARMQDTLKDQMFEQGLQRHGRKGIVDVCKRGVGILKWPFPQYKRKVKVRPNGDGQDVSVEMVKLSVPGMAYVDPRMFFYDMVPDLAQSRKTFEVVLKDRAGLMELKHYPNMIVSAIDELLENQQPCAPKSLGGCLGMWKDGCGMVEPLDGRWAIIETHMAIDAKRLANLTGVEWPHPDVMPLIEVWWCDGKCIKWKLSPLECGYRVPYYNFTPFPIDDTIYGASLPFWARAAQRNLDGAAEATMENAAMAAGPTIILKKGTVSPQDGSWRLGGGIKIFQAVGDVDDVRKVFNAEVIESNVEGNIALCDKFLEWMDQDTLLSQLLQGAISEVRSGPASALVQLINLATIIQRDIASAADDGWFQPMAENGVLWNKIYSKDPSIMGDFNVKGIASSALVSRDIQVQHLQVLTQMSGDPRFAGFSDDYDLFAANVKMLEIPGKDSIVYPRDKALEEQKKRAAAGGDPMIAVKQAEVEAKMRQIESDTQVRMADIQRQQQKDQMDAELQRLDMQTRLIVSRNELQVALLQAQSRQELEAGKLAADLQKATMDDETTRLLKSMEITAKARVETAKLASSPSPYSAQD